MTTESANKVNSKSPRVWFPADLAKVFDGNIEGLGRFVVIVIGAIKHPGPVPGQVRVFADQVDLFNKLEAAGFVVLDEARTNATIVNFTTYRYGPDAEVTP